MRAWLPAAVSVSLAAPAAAADLKVKIEIPRLNVAEYHRPYVAIWLERPDQSFVVNLAVWYDLALKNKEGNQWLKDLRQWWRRSGRALDMPVDDITGPTRPPGEHEVVFSGGAAPLKDLPAGQYRLVIEAAREVGGREILHLPFEWPGRAGQTGSAKGEHELGAVALELKP